MNRRTYMLLALALVFVVTEAIAQSPAKYFAHKRKAFKPAAAGELGSPGFDTGAGVYTASTASFVTPAFTSTGANRLMVAYVLQFSGLTINSVTVSNTGTSATAAMTLYALTNWYDATGKLGLYQLVNPDSGTHTVHVVLSGVPGHAVCAAMSLTNVNQSTPLGTAVMWYTGSTSIPGYTNTITCGATDFLIDGFGSYPSAGTFTPGTGQTERVNTYGGEQVHGRASTKAATGTSEPMSETVTVVNAFGAISVAVKSR